ncbi:hypothetical protein [Streptomyces sp. AC495_CC817]|uniref:hypothetical protein n=1 Tax=Streptomyces sp. AC495_CC817 TaxID=2823900 RepID=UPI001C276DF7|nr:hypothetical protein [Streptomyces sp. AC495_CC817]
MFVSAEIIAVIASAIGTVLTIGAAMFAGFAWCVRRIDAVDTKLTARIDAVTAALTARIDVVAADTTELKISLARIEGPPRLLIATR